ncbi:hypothetical protein C2845_PM04G00100 [Panicum miliaceum]|uniref:Plastocyanin-like domain-containing protein n=1 Tax=Panicum miliaceum TaxID=4540 RepID=A0A3L6QR92_PANMI|nr:hypothetical protein C2845_PM04G00100 [Panicum miliaceum]
MNQTRSFRWNLTASAVRPNPTPWTLVLASSSPAVAGQRRCAVNGVPFVVSIMLLKLPARPDGGAVVRLNLHEFVEVVFQNTENELQSWHLDGYDFWFVG